MSLFIDEKSNVDKDAVREHVLKSLQEHKQTLDVLLHGVETRDFWNSLHNAIGTMKKKDRESLRRVENQLTELSEYVNGWITMSVDSPERFEFFVLTKAKEISSGDTQKDYFWALQIRHDQLVGLVRVLDALVKKISLWTSMSAEEVLEDEVFLGMSEKGIEEQVYMEAESVHEERESLNR